MFALGGLTSTKFWRPAPPAEKKNNHDHDKNETMPGRELPKSDWQTMAHDIKQRRRRQRQEQWKMAT